MRPAITKIMGRAAKGNSGVEVGVAVGEAVAVGLAEGLDVEPDVGDEVEVDDVEVAVGLGEGLVRAVGEFSAITTLWLL